MSGPQRQDRFGSEAAAYATFRPRYPEALFEAIAALAPSRRLAWDCATGSGQAAEGLASRFERVVATDSSEKQLAHAVRRDNIEYRVAPAEASGIASHSVDLVTIAQALHWLDREAFWSEVRRVAVPGGVIAVWCYELLETGTAVDPIVMRYYTEIVGPYWAPERRLVETGYRTIEFPFERLALPDLAIEADLDVDALTGLLGTWSATIAFRKATGVDPLPAVREELIASWGATSTTPKRVRWPLAVMAGRVRPSSHARASR